MLPFFSSWNSQRSLFAAIGVAIRSVSSATPHGAENIAANGAILLGHTIYLWVFRCAAERQHWLKSAMQYCRRTMLRCKVKFGSKNATPLVKWFMADFSIVKWKSLAPKLLHPFMMILTIWLFIHELIGKVESCTSINSSNICAQELKKFTLL